MKRITTHRNPDADAVLAAYLMQRYAFNGDAEVVFIPRAASLSGFDCAVDIGRIYDPSRLFFDHKPPAFPDRNQFCAATLVWKWLLAQGAEVNFWRELVEVVHEGDARPPRRASPPLQLSRREGLHALITQNRLQNATDTELYQSARAALDALFLKSA